MTLGETLISVGWQWLAEGRQKVELEDKHYPIRLFRAKKLRSVDFSHGGMSIIGIEQNPATESRWTRLGARREKIMQFRCRDRYVANVCEGHLLRYHFAFVFPHPRAHGRRVRGMIDRRVYTGGTDARPSPLSERVRGRFSPQSADRKFHILRGLGSLIRK
jgi:hypothetical protein